MNKLQISNNIFNDCKQHIYILGDNNDLKCYLKLHLPSIPIYYQRADAVTAMLETLAETISPVLLSTISPTKIICMWNLFVSFNWFLQWVKHFPQFQFIFLELSQKMCIRKRNLIDVYIIDDLVNEESKLDVISTEVPERIVTEISYHVDVFACTRFQLIGPNNILKSYIEKYFGKYELSTKTEFDEMSKKMNQRIFISGTEFKKHEVVFVRAFVENPLLKVTILCSKFGFLHSELPCFNIKHTNKPPEYLSEIFTLCRRIAPRHDVKILPMHKQLIHKFLTRPSKTKFSAKVDQKLNPFNDEFEPFTNEFKHKTYNVYFKNSFHKYESFARFLLYLHGFIDTIKFQSLCIDFGLQIPLRDEYCLPFSPTSNISQISRHEDIIENELENLKKIIFNYLDQGFLNIYYLKSKTYVPILDLNELETYPPYDIYIDVPDIKYDLCPQYLIFKKYWRKNAPICFDDVVFGEKSICGFNLTSFIKQVHKDKKKIKKRNITSVVTKNKIHRNVIRFEE